MSLRTNVVIIIILLSILSVRAISALPALIDDAEAIKISGGETHTMVLSANKWVWGCGDNDYSQLGIGSSYLYADQRILVRVHGQNDSGRLEDINNVAAGWKHSLALDVNGLVWSWGANAYGQLGDATDDDKHTPVQVLSGEQDPNSQTSLLKYIQHISAGRSGEHSLAVDANGYAYAWGRNTHGQCGNGGGSNSELTPVRVVAGEQDVSDPNSLLEQIIAVSAGECHSMALEKIDPNLNGSVYTWGDDTYGPEGEQRGVLGTGGTGEISAVRPVRVWAGEQDYNEPNHVYLKHIVAISAGWDHSMALEKYEVYDPFVPNFDPNHKGRVYTWGNNENTSYSYGGRLGNDTTTSSGVPVVVHRGQQEPEDPCNPDPNLTRIVAVSAGEGHSMALDVNGYVYCWGDNRYGQLGDGTSEQSLVPVKVVGEDRNRNGTHDANEGYLENIVAISPGYWHSLAIDANGTIWTWGKGSAGRLGDTTPANINAGTCRQHYIDHPNR